MQHLFSETNIEPHSLLCSIIQIQKQIGPTWICLHNLTIRKGSYELPIGLFHIPKVVCKGTNSGTPLFIQSSLSLGSLDRIINRIVASIGDGRTNLIPVLATFNGL